MLADLISFIMQFPITGSFGLFGLRKEEIANPMYNYIGVALALTGFLVFLQVKSEPRELNSAEAALLDSKVPLVSDDELETRSSNLSTVGEISSEDKSCGKSLSVTQRRVVGLTMACITGLLFGCSFDPAQYVIDTEYGGNDDTLNYVFPHFCGIIIASWMYFALYICYNASIDRTPYIERSIILPAMISGVLWGIAEIAWFVANGIIGFSIAFPIITFGPGFVGAMWGILVFKEISGFRNLVMLSVAFVITLPGLILVALSH